MKKRNSKILAGLMTATLLLGNTMPVFAADISVTSDTANGNTPTEFSVDADAIGGGLVVTIPASLDLTANGDGDFVANDVVSAYGNINACKAVTVSTDNEITYVNADDASISVTGAVTFGSDGAEQWTAEETKNSITTLDSRPINVKVAKDDIDYIGTYNTKVYFNINVNYVVSPASWFAWLVGSTSVSIDGLSRNAESTDIIVPSTYQGLPVVSVAFSGSSITSVVLPDSMTTIKDYSFKNCEYLASVTMSDNVTEIGKQAFMRDYDEFWTPALTSITLPSSLTTLGQYAFANQSELASITYKGTEYTSKAALTAALTAAGVSVGTGAFEDTGLTD